MKNSFTDDLMKEILNKVDDKTKKELLKEYSIIKNKVEEIKQSYGFNIGDRFKGPSLKDLFTNNQNYTPSEIYEINDVGSDGRIYFLTNMPGSFSHHPDDLVDLIKRGKFLKI